MGVYTIFLYSLFTCTMLAERAVNGLYEYKFRTCSYVKEVNNVMINPQTRFHICRLPVDERTKICKAALKEEFCIYNRIKYKDDIPLGEEKLYEVFLNGIFYEGKRPPFVVSACMCPTAPAMYLKDATNGTDVRIYVNLPIGEYEFGYTVPMEDFTHNSVI